MPLRAFLPPASAGHPCRWCWSGLPSALVWPPALRAAAPSAPLLRPRARRRCSSCLQGRTSSATSRRQSTRCCWPTPAILPFRRCGRPSACAGSAGYGPSLQWQCCCGTPTRCFRRPCPLRRRQRCFWWGSTAPPGRTRRSPPGRAICCFPAACWRRCAQGRSCSAAVLWLPVQRRLRLPFTLAGSCRCCSCF